MKANVLRNKKEHCFWKAHRLRPFFLLVTATVCENEKGILVESHRREVCWIEFMYKVNTIGVREVFNEFDDLTPSMEFTIEEESEEKKTIFLMLPFKKIKITRNSQFLGYR